MDNKEKINVHNSNFVGDNHFLFLNSHRKDYFGKYNEALNEKNKDYQGYILEEVFFSNKNIEIIQKQLIMFIYNESNKKYLIPKQKNESIIIVMKYIFNTYAQHLPFKVKEQIAQLNDKVVGEIAADIISNLNSKEIYLKDINRQPELLDRPLNVSNAGNRTLPSFMTQI